VNEHLETLTPTLGVLAPLSRRKIILRPHLMGAFT
jgi:hypothetical protein